MDNVRALSRNDFVRLGLVTRPGDDDSLPYSQHYVADFEKRYCYDRYWTEGGDGHDGRNTRYLCCGHGLTVVGDAKSAVLHRTPTPACSRSSGTSTSCCS